MLRNHGYKVAPNWMNTRLGKPWLRKNGRLFYVTEWVHGRPLGHSEEDLCALGTTLARLHNISQKFIRTTVPLRSVKVSRHQNARFRRMLPIIQSRQSPHGKWYTVHGQTCKNLADETWAILRSPDVAPVLRHALMHPSWIHGDVTRMNVIVSNSRARLIDWDRIRPGFALLELVKALANTTGFSCSEMKTFLQGYESKRPLASGERHIVRALFRLPREAWTVGKRIAAGRSASGSDVLFDTWEVRLQAIHWLDRWAQDGSSG